MRAAILRAGQIVVDDMPEPSPAPGQVLVETIACGICGSDLHCRLHAHDLVAASKASGMTLFVFDPDADVVMGHEFSARVVGLGAGVSGLSEGDEVVAHPGLVVDRNYYTIGYSNTVPGGFAERMVLDATGTLPIPNGVDPRWAALTEPMAVGLHAVNASWVDKTKSAVVLGSGPVGLAVIAALRVRGVPLIIASDYSPGRRALATKMGAHVVIDPSVTTPMDAYRAAGGGERPTVIFDAIGVPGIIESAIASSTRNSQVVVVGLCMQTDRIWPAVAINKQITLSFVLGWTPEEFRASLFDIAEGRIDAASLISADVTLDAVATAFDELAQPDRHAKVLVRPNGL